MIEVFIALGANADNPVHQVKSAIQQLEALAEGPLAASSLWESEPVAMNDDSGVFVNAVVVFQTSLPATSLLKQLQQIEIEMGRPKDHGKNVARRIDLDILTYGSEQIHVQGLEIPHPRIEERLFVLLPLQELRPDFVLPGSALSLPALIDAAPAMAISRR